MDVVIVSTNDKYYLGKDNTSKFVKVTSLNQAEIFASILKANNVITNCLIKSEQNKWKAQYIDEVKKKILEKQEKTKDNNNKLYNINGFDFGECLCEVDSVLKKCTEQKAILGKQLSKVDLEISDITHFIRDQEKIHVCKWVKIFKILMEKEKERGRIKEQFRKINILVNTLEESFDKSQIELQLKEVESKPYNPRTDMWNVLSTL